MEQICDTPFIWLTCTWWTKTLIEFRGPLNIRSEPGGWPIKKTLVRKNGSKQSVVHEKSSSLANMNKLKWRSCRTLTYQYQIHHNLSHHTFTYVFLLVIWFWILIISLCLKSDLSSFLFVFSRVIVWHLVTTNISINIK